MTHAQAFLLILRSSTPFLTLSSSKESWRLGTGDRARRKVEEVCLSSDLIVQFRIWKAKKVFIFLMQLRKVKMYEILANEVV